MAKIALIWEMGADLGHVFGLRTLAIELCRRGHKVTLVLSDTTLFDTFLSGDKNTDCPFSVLKGPSVPAAKKRRLSRPPANLTELLLVNGYNDADYLVTQILHWRQLIGELNPDVIVYDFAPTALLASRDRVCKKITLGSPFTMPPLLQPLPSFNLDTNVSDTNLGISENTFVHSVNAALAMLELAPIQAARDIFIADQQFITSLPELDPYRQWREVNQYVGAIVAVPDTGKNLQWSTEKKVKKLFAYLKPTYGPLDACLDVLDKIALQGRVYVPHLPDDIAARFTHSNLMLSSTPYSLAELSACDLVICHGGNGTVAASVQNGVPCLIIPQQQEQLMTAHQCMAAGLGLGLGPHVTDREKITAVINRLLTDTRFKQTAQLCQQKYHHLMQQPALDKILLAIEFGL